MTKRPWTVVLAVVLGACAEQGTVLEILYATVPDETTCVVAVSGVQRQHGIYDPIVGDGYHLHLVVRNNLEPREENPRHAEGPNSVKPYANDATVLGLDTCWYVPYQREKATLSLGSHGDGPALACDDLGSSSRFVHTGTTIPADDLEHLVSAPVLTHDDLRDVFGSLFKPDDLLAAALTAVPHDTNGNGSTADAGDFYIPMWPSSPADVPDEKTPCVNGSVDGRDSAWGCFPTQRTTVVVVTVRVVAQLLTGHMVHSNWFSYPVDLRPGEQLRECDPVLLGQTCSDGTVELLGEEPLSASCDAASFYADVLCEEHAGCDAEE